MSDTTSTGPAASQESGTTSGTDGGSSGPTTEGASGAPGSTPVSSTSSPASYRDKVAAARAKALEAPKPDPKAASSSTGIQDTKASGDSPPAKAGEESGASPPKDDDVTERVAELGRAARTAREAAAAAKKEQEAAKLERAQLAKEREEARADLDLSKQLKALKSEGKYAEAWALFAGDKAHDMEVFTQIAERVSGNDGTVTAADVAKMVESKLADAEAAKEKADAEAKKTKEREAEEKREKAWSEYLDTESDDPKERGVIPTYAAEKDKWPAIKARGASREYLMKVTREMRAKAGTVPTSTELLDEINRRLDADIEREAKARGYVKPEAKKPPPSVDPKGGSPRPRPSEEDRRPGESAYQAKLRLARQALRS